MLDNSILPTETNSVRVSTPPRVITLSEHHFPSATDDQYTPDEEHGNHREFDQSSIGSIEDKRLLVSKPKKMFQNDLFNTRWIRQDNLFCTRRRWSNRIRTNLFWFFFSFFLSYSREATPPYGEHITPTEEILHLRRQVSKLNRRVLTIEFDNVQRQQREKIVYCVGLAYFLIKAIMWLNRNWIAFHTNFYCSTTIATVCQLLKLQIHLTQNTQRHTQTYIQFIVRENIPSKNSKAVLLDFVIK